MKKILLILLCLFSLNTLTYASFPITESPTEQLSESNTEASVSANSLASSMGGLHWAWWVVIIIFALLLSYILFAVFYVLSTFP
jgi:hypothetical protein